MWAHEPPARSRSEVLWEQLDLALLHKEEGLLEMAKSIRRHANNVLAVARIMKELRRRNEHGT